MDKQEKLHLYHERLQSHGFSNSSIKIYLASMRHVLDEFHPMSIHEVGGKRIASWLGGLRDKGMISTSYCHLIKCALKQYLKLMEAVEPSMIILPKLQELQNCNRVVEVETIKRILEAAASVKHKLIMMMAYGAGLRPGEIRDLQMEDINFHSQRVLIQGRFRRRIPISNALHKELCSYCDIANSRCYLFEGYSSGTQMTERAMQLVPVKAARLIGISENISLGMLRNSFGVHLFEKGVDVSLISDLMRYKWSRSALKFAHVAKHRPIQLPLDYIL